MYARFMRWSILAGLLAVGDTGGVVGRRTSRTPWPGVNEAKESAQPGLIAGAA